MQTGVGKPHLFLTFIPMSKQIIFLLALGSFWSCQSGDSVAEEMLFVSLNAEQTGIAFNNRIVPNDTLNLLSYEYLYNGGGLGVGDFNRDGLPDVIFTGNETPSAIYLNEGGFQFKDITSASGLDTKGRWCTGVSVIDINLDGYDDIYLSVGGPGNQSDKPNLLYINQGDLTFREMAVEYGLAYPGESIQAVFLDYDLDGDLDMYLLNGGGFEKSAVSLRPMSTNGSSRNNDRLFRNDYSTEKQHAFFTDVTIEAGIVYEGFGLGLGVLDANQDGWPDIYVSNDYLSRDLLYINQKNGSFSEEALTRLGHMSQFSMGNACGDVNNDGFTDILTLDMLPEDYARRKLMSGPNGYDRYHQAASMGYGFQQMRNMLQLADGMGGFSELGQWYGVDKTDWSWGPLLADFDDDGFQDLYITNGYGKDITDLDFVNFRANANAPFGDAAKARKQLMDGLEDLPEILVPNYIFQNSRGERYENKTGKWLTSKASVSNGAVYADFDQDGDIDIITNNINQKAFCLKNTSIESGQNPGFLNIKLEFSEQNPEGIGSTVCLFQKNGKQTRYVSRTIGFQSSVLSEVHFGLGDLGAIDSLVVYWPDHNITVTSELPTDTSLVLQPDQMRPRFEPAKPMPLFEKETLAGVGQHQESAHSDFKTQSLLFQTYNQSGPGMAAGDINQDGLEDLFIGGAYGFEAQILVGQKDGGYQIKYLDTKNYEDTGALFFDLDGDGDQDLYVASGGNERHRDHEGYQDRIYLNEKGEFVLSNLLDKGVNASTLAVCGADFDQDGDIDLFVGGRLVPGRYPEIPRSYLLENVGGKLVDITSRFGEKLMFPGMVSSAIWTDIDNDDDPDLMITGEWMYPMVWINAGGKLSEASDKWKSDRLTGLWNSILASDLDNDGDLDFILGNMGKNNPFLASNSFPMMLFYGDFDRNGSVDPILSLYQNKAYYPYASLNMLAEQLPLIKKQFLFYRDFAQMKTDQLLDYFTQVEPKVLNCRVLETLILENKNGELLPHILPYQAQSSPVFGIQTMDVNGDGLADIILAGNHKGMEVVCGPHDSGAGLVLINGGNFSFKALSAAESGIYIKEEVRAMLISTSVDQHAEIIFGVNKGLPKKARLSSFRQGSAIPVLKGEVSAVESMRNGSTKKIEFNAGGGYLSQNSRTVFAGPHSQSISFINNQGLQTRSINF